MAFKYILIYILTQSVYLARLEISTTENEDTSFSYSSTEPITEALEEATTEIINKTRATTEISTIGSKQNASQTHEIPMQILQMSEKKFTLNKEYLQAILLREDVKDVPVAVISIAGAFRGGKSFMLDYFIRYLQATPEERKDGAWLGDKDKPLKGFSWRGGSERNTLGVLMWSDPYFVTLEDGTKVAVLLVDTQGIFDNDSTVTDYSTIFAFSSLISSLILFNVRENIKEDDLNHLHLFSKFGELAKTDKGKLYQNLEFLVRDFPFPEETPYGPEGGQTLIDKRLQIKDGQPSELQDVRKDLLASYEKICAFLMPHPGFGVFHSKYDGSWSVLTEDFKTYLQVLVNSIFSPSKIVPRKIGSLVVTGKHLYEFTNSFMEVFHGNDIPTLKTILKATIEVILRHASREALDHYHNNMEAELGFTKPSVTASAVNIIHMKLKNESLDMLTTKGTIGDSDDLSPYLIKLQEDIEDELNYYFRSNELKLQKAITEGKEEYHVYIKNVTKNESLCLVPDELSKVHKEAIEAGLKAFESNRREVEDVPDEEKNLFLESLAMNYDNLRSTNNLNNMAIVNEIILAYNSEMDEYLTKSPPYREETLENLHSDKYEKAKHDLESKRNRASDFTDSYKSILSEKLLSSYTNYKISNQNRNRTYRQRAFYQYTLWLAYFWNTDDEYSICASPTVLEDYHKRYKRDAIKLLRSDEYCWDKECKLLETMINLHYQDVEETNRLANERFVDHAYNRYKEIMDEKTSFSGWWIAGIGIPYLVNKSYRIDYHNEAKERAFNYFEQHRNTYTRDNYYSDLDWRMYYAYKTYYE